MPTYSIKEWPSEERPRERLERLGPGALSARELLALLIETGTPATTASPARSALDVAAALLRHFGGEGEETPLRRIATASAVELCEVPGIGPAKAAKVLAALDLGRRAEQESRASGASIRGARDVYERMRRMRDLPHEEFHILLLNIRNVVIRDLQVTRGTLDGSLVHPREVFRPAVVHAAAAIVLVHNHPSGDPTPSSEDRTVTRQLRNAGRSVGIEVLDHVVVGESRYFSFMEAGELE